ncbi:MAG: FHA domain-containing protein [Verrucomicrobiae bacterium]|nr:FHA domain-containing protein [Verrucomicrobiae bacterium]
MALKLVVTTNVNGDVFELILKNARYGVGRRSDNDLRIKETYISGYHAELVRGEKEEFYVSDLGSSNGTFLNGRRVQGKELIKAGDFIKFGILKVAVQEHTETMPKIVALKDRPEFSRKDESNTSAISVERKTGTVATVGAGSDSGGTRAVATSSPTPKPAAAPPQAKDKAVGEPEKKLLAELKSKLEAGQKEVATLKSTLSEREKRLAEAESRIEHGVKIEKELKVRDADLAKSRSEVEAVRQELERVQSEVKESSLRLEESRSDVGKLSDELAALREALENSQSEALNASNSLAEAKEAVSEKEAEVRRLEAERDTLGQSLDAKEKDLSKSVGKLAEAATLATTIAALEGQLAESRSRLEEAEALSLRQEAGLREKDDILDARAESLARLEAQVSGLASAAESDQAALASELAETRVQAAKAATELKQALADKEEEQKRSLAAAREAEKEKTKAEKAFATLESKHAKQGEDFQALKTSLQEKEAELRSLSREASKGAASASQLETLKAELADATAALDANRSREAVLLEEKKQAESRLATLDTALAEAEERVRVYESEIDTGKGTAEALSTELAKVAAEFEAFRHRSESEAAEAGKLAEVANLNLEKERSDWQARLTELESRAASQQALVASETSQREELVRERDRLLVELGDLRAAGDGSAAELVTLREQYAALESQRDQWHQLENNQAGELQAAKAEANELRIELRKSKDGLEKNLRELEASLRSRIAELETALSSERVRATDTGAEKSRLEESLASLRAEMDALREESSQLRFRNEEASRNNGRLQAELNREATERAQVNEALDSSRVRVNGLVAEIEVLKNALEGKERESAEREQQFARSESEIVQKLKRELSEAVSARETAEEKSAKSLREKQVLGGSFERLKEQLDAVETELRATKEAGEEMLHSKGLLARRLEKAEASNSELAARIREEAQAALASRELIEKLETQIRENESEAVRREREQVAALQADLSRASRRTAEDERRRRDLETELSRTQDARKQAEERVLALEARLVEQEAETGSTRSLLSDTEKARVDLASRLATESALSATHARTVEGLRRELAETISRFTASETALISKHGEASDALLAELQSERLRREGLEDDLVNTREGLSEALRHAREGSARAQARLLAEGNAQLSSVEEELSAAISAREAVEESRSALEDELNEREEEIERLCEHIESLENRLNDEAETQKAALRLLDTTRAGFSETLRSGRERLSRHEEKLDEEARARREAEEALVRSREEIDRLNGEVEEGERRRQSEVRSWEDRYETLRVEKLTLASEDADLRKIRDEIVAGTARRRALEDEIEKFAAGVKEIQSKQGELQAQRESLVAEREQLKATLNAARLELGSLQKQCAESRDLEAKYAGTITAAERRIQSLRKLETEMEQAVERRRQLHQLSRSEVFSGQPDDTSVSSEFSQEEFYRKLIAKLDLIDDLAKRYDNKWLYPKVSEQLGILKRSFLELLEDHSVQPFNLEPGTVISITERRRIKLVPLQNGAPKQVNGSQSSLVVETVRPGYVYKNGAQDVIIRKAEVVVS